LAQQIINEHAPKATSMLQGGGGELIFTGTASALPCKHRNVTGMLLKQSDHRSIVLDIGEGTMGQLLRMRSACEDRQQQCRHIYNEIKAVWISHPHADHHLGLVRLLKDRRQYTTEQLLVIAPTPIFRFLDELSVIDNEIQGSYIAVDCKDLVGESPEFLPHQQTIQDVLGITKCRAVPVAHCAHAYAVILDGTSFGRVVYSGDCRPSTQLALIAKGADVLIHESTFESDMQADAVLKKHSTIDEALNVGRQMECKCIVLTHFSQRYSKVPPLPSKSDDDYPFPIIYAYDFMKLQPHTLLLASNLTPALRLLFAEDTAQNSSDEADGMDSIEPFNGADILSIPGAFANASLL
jgi:ribonuclease Z